MKLDSIWQADTQQGLFRHLMNAMAYPGRIHDLQSLLNGTDAWRGVLAVLLDASTSLCDEDGLLAAQDWPLLQAIPRENDEADYILCKGDQPGDLCPRLGDLTHPEHSTTVLITVDALQGGEQTVQLSGPGIAAPVSIHPRGLHAHWWQWRAQWSGVFPLGLDIILMDRQGVMCLPRSTQAELVS